MSTFPHPLSVDLRRLAEKHGKEWKSVFRGRADADEVCRCIGESLNSKFADRGTFQTTDTDLVVFGSLARQEWTSGSDVDWTLLVDGQAVPQHRPLAIEIGRIIEDTRFHDKPLPKPGGTGRGLLET